ncbi:MAG: hypothetical protein HQL69_01475 [Magnetococcales bacterium]|nr:hypothetical protein [Magnetococcales bacterium]
MTKDGLLNLIDNPNHKRAKYIELTPKGEDIYLQLFQKHIPWAEKSAGDLTEKELETALAVVEKISKKLG